MTSEMIEMLLLLLAGHALCDYPLQGDFLARGKSRRAPLAFVGIPWWQCMSAHCAIHAGMVLVVTGSIALALAEFVFHFLIDMAKCDFVFGEGERAFNIDQALHVACKALWVILAMWVLP